MKPRPIVTAFEPVTHKPKPSNLTKTQRKKAARRAAVARANSIGNVLDDRNLTLAGAIDRYRATGKPVPAHLADRVQFVSGSETPREGGTTLPQNMQINRPFYRMGPLAHPANPNPCQSAQPRIPGK